MNREYLAQQLDLIDTYLRRASSIAKKSKVEFLSDSILIDAAVREIVVLFETSHNIAKHIIAESTWRKARSKAEAFDVLAEHNVIRQNLCESLRKASRFRNLVTYQTAQVLDEVVFRILTDHVSDFEEFARQIAAWLNRDETGQG